jgi:2,3-dihydroxybenzoate decarboxylase
MGETLPLNLRRFDSRWMNCIRRSRSLPEMPSHCIKRKIAITTSGICTEAGTRAHLH